MQRKFQFWCTWHATWSIINNWYLFEVLIPVAMTPVSQTGNLTLVSPINRILTYSPSLSHTLSFPLTLSLSLSLFHPVSLSHTHTLMHELHESILPLLTPSTVNHTVHVHVSPFYHSDTHFTACIQVICGTKRTLLSNAIEQIQFKATLSNT